MASSRERYFFFFGLLTIILLLNAYIFYPFLSIIIFASAIATLFSPLYIFFLRRMPTLPTFASFLTLGIVLLLVLLPLIAIAALALNEMQSLYDYLTVDQTLTFSLHNVFDVLHEQFPLLGISSRIVDAMQEYALTIVDYFVRHLGFFFSSIVSFAIDFALFFLLLFFFLRDGRRIKNFFARLHLLIDAHDDAVVNRLQYVMSAVVRGVLLVAFVQGICAGIGYALFGVPSPVLLAIITAFSSLIPGLGTMLVIIPASAFLFFSEQVGFALGLLLWGVFIVGLLDNLLRPQLLAHDIGVHPILVLFAVFGGLWAFGFAGILLGPLLVSALSEFIALREREVEQGLSQ